MGILEDEVVKMLDINDTDLCYCGSGERFYNCCKTNIHPTRINQERFYKNKEIFLKSGGKFPTSIFKKTFNGLGENCLICGNKAINSHTVSDNWMRKIFTDDFVTCPLPTDKGGISLQKIPINKASTFYGWCKIHDDQIFNSIDNGLDLNNDYHKNLLCYRTIGREYKMKNNQLKLSYSIFVNIGNKIQNGDMLKQFIGAYQGMIDVYDIMQEVASNIADNNILNHEVFELGTINPLFVSSAFHTDIDNGEILIFTIYTDKDGQGYCLISYKTEHESAKYFCENIVEKNDNGNLIQYLNKIISQNCENIICDTSREGEVIDEDGSLNVENIFESQIHNYIKIIE